jgi:histidinol-phosphate aminotransferase
VEDGGTVGCFDPSYSLYPVLAEIRGVRTVEVSLAGDFGWPGGPGAGTALEAARGCSLFFMARPNAPTGVAYPRETVRAFCEGFDGAVLIDEAYVDFAREHDMALAVRLPNVLVMRTLSKSYALAGLRLGYVVGARRLIGALFKLKDSYNVDRLAQRLAVAALRDRSYMRRTAARVRATRARLAAALAGRGFRVYPSETNFLWVRPPGVAARRLCAALRRRGVLVRHFAGRRTGAFLRITVGSEGEVERLRRALDGLRPKPRGGRRQRGEDGV